MTDVWINYNDMMHLLQGQVSFPVKQTTLKVYVFQYSEEFINVLHESLTFTFTYSHSQMLLSAEYREVTHSLLCLLFSISQLQ